MAAPALTSDRQSLDLTLATRVFILALRNGVIVVGLMAVLAYFLETVVHPALSNVKVQEDLTLTAARLLTLLLPFAGYLIVGTTARRLRQSSQFRPSDLIVSLLVVWVSVTLIFAAITLIQSAAAGDSGPAQQPSLQFTLTQTDEGILVESVESGGAAELAGIQAGDLITAIRRDPVSRDELLTLVAEAEADAPFRLRIMRNGEELQLTARVAMVASDVTNNPLAGLPPALVVGTVGLFWPAMLTPYVLLALSLVPLLTGYVWLVIATFSYRTEGLTPVDASGTVGGLTLDNWNFLSGSNITGQTVNIWSITLNSFMIAALMTTVSLLICSMTGYALSRMNFAGRRWFLSLTLILHGFPAITLIIPIYLVLVNLGNLPLIGRFIGFNTLGGIALVMVAFELPLGVWLMKGFFDTISWDMERSALIDGATRWRTFWEIILPQIRPGLLALGIFSFIGGWNSYLIPATYSIGTGTSNLPVYISQLVGDVAPVNWNQVAAVGLFQLIPIIIFFVFAQEYLLNIYAGGTKGSS